MTKTILSCLAVLALAACGGGGGGGTSLPPTPQATAQPVLVTLGDSITATYSDPVINATLYPTLLANALGATLVDLGIPGEPSGPVKLTYSAAGVLLYGAYGGVLADEVPNIPLNATLVTLYIGTNDIYVMSTQQLADYSTTAQLAATEAAEYAANISAIVAGIHTRVPRARLVVASVPDPAWRPVSVNAPLIERSAYVTMTDAMRTTLIGTGANVVDLLCEPAMYNDANFGNPYDVHPLASGHAVIAADFLAQIQHPTPVKDCSYEST